jgi:hypothetical protein
MKAYNERYTAPVSDEFRWAGGKPDLRNGLTPREVIDALYAPAVLRLDNRTPAAAPTFLAVCAPTDDLRLIVVVCTRDAPDGVWTIAGARDATNTERAMWRKHTS